MEGEITSTAARYCRYGRVAAALRRDLISLKRATGRPVAAAIADELEQLEALERREPPAGPT
jgi:hypothetical protein